MNAYQAFQDFFSMHNKERLDGLSESYFAAMTLEERGMAFDYLLKLVEDGGTEESVNGLFLADSKRAVAPIKHLLGGGALNGESQIAAAWNLSQTQAETNLLPIFTKFISSPDRRLRAKAAYYVPPVLLDDLKTSLQQMIRTETEQLPRIHAVNKLLECYCVTEESVGKSIYSDIYRGLHSEDLSAKERAFKQLDAIYE